MPRFRGHPNEKQNIAMSHACLKESVLPPGRRHYDCSVNLLLEGVR